jgi:hypothetical protein
MHLIKYRYSKKSHWPTSQNILTPPVAHLLHPMTTLATPPLVKVCIWKEKEVTMFVVLLLNGMKVLGGDNVFLHLFSLCDNGFRLKIGLRGPDQI